MGNLAISASAVLYISGHLQHQFCTWVTCKKVHFDIFLAIQIKSILRGELEGDLEAHTFPKAIYAFLELLRRYIIHIHSYTHIGNISRFGDTLERWNQRIFGSPTCPGLYIRHLARPQKIFFTSVAIVCGHGSYCLHSVNILLILYVDTDHIEYETVNILLTLQLSVDMDHFVNY